MRLINYLNEQGYKKVNIQPFLNEFGDVYQDDLFIWRGTKDTIQSYKPKRVRKDRQPRLVSQELHEYLSNLSRELWGWDMRREGVFTGSSSITEMYGKPYIFIPVGEYEYVWTDDASETYSLYDSITDKGFNDEFVDEYLRELKDIYEQSYYTSGLSNFLDMGSTHDWEAVFKCDQYLLFNSDFFMENKQDILGR